ncbi:hypothetical protein [Luteibacter sp. E-22]|uniref:hypothetical protein n=1 Tax=Luteibacter sp. E-22 TaxID=3404050 RepID=UPI003CE798E7
MKISEPTTIFDPYEWLPGYGESSVAIVSKGLELAIAVKYDYEDPSSREMCIAERTFLFDYATAFLRQPFPGGFAFEVVGEASGLKLGRLTEFRCSEYVDHYLRARATVTAHPPPPVRHFSIQFLSENLDVHVLASDVRLSGEIIVTRGIQPALAMSAKPHSPPERT